MLRLARNRLQTLPEALGCYGRLQVLDCSGNRLTSVPRVVGRCTALQQLLMASNRLRGLTSGIGNLVRLQVLDLSHNQYRHLPTMTGDLTQLQVSVANQFWWLCGLHQHPWQLQKLQHISSDMRCVVRWNSLQLLLHCVVVHQHSAWKYIST